MPRSTLIASIPANIPGDVDRPSVAILQRFDRGKLDSFSPRAVVGDGNCYYRAVSLALYGHEDHHRHLRAVTAIEMIKNREYYDVEGKYYNLDDRIETTEYNPLISESLIDGSLRCTSGHRIV